MNSLLKKSGLLLALAIMLLSSFSLVQAKSDEELAIEYMENRQEAIKSNYNTLMSRIDSMGDQDPRKQGADEMMDAAKTAVDDFYNLPVDASYVTSDNMPNEEFTDAESNAVSKINLVNRYLISPVHPGAEKFGDKGTVPEGDLMTDFIPQLIRLLMRFASFAVLISFIISGIFFVISHDNEERITKAKQMLYYTLVGFAFVTLAFAIVKAVTDIDFFGFI